MHRPHWALLHVGSFPPGLLFPQLPDTMVVQPPKLSWLWLLCSDQLRSTRSALGDGTSSKASDVLGDTSRPFNFETLAKSRGIKLTCITCSAKENELQEVQTFVRQHVRI